MEITLHSFFNVTNTSDEKSVRQQNHQLIIKDDFFLKPNMCYVCLWNKKSSLIINILLWLYKKYKAFESLLFLFLVSAHHLLHGIYPMDRMFSVRKRRSQSQIVRKHCNNSLTRHSIFLVDSFEHQTRFYPSKNPTSSLRSRTINRRCWSNNSFILFICSSSVDVDGRSSRNLTWPSQPSLKMFYHS